MSLEFTPQSEFLKPYTPYDSIHRQILLACERSFDYFAKFIGYPQADFHKEWRNFFVNNLDSVVAAPRNSGKSMWVTLIIAWMMIFPKRWREQFGIDYQFFEIAYVTSTDKIGKKWMKKFNMEVEIFIKKLRLEAQLKIDISNTETLQLSNNSKVEMVAILGAIRGIRGHFCFSDDLMKDKGQKISDVISAFEGSVMPIRYPSSHNILLGTVKADDDIIMKMLRNKGYAGKLYKSINHDDKGKAYPLWEERPLSFLYDMKRKMTPVTFSREYQNEPVSDEFAVMNLNLLQSCNDDELKIRETMDGAMYMGVDLARSDTKQADYTVIIVFEVLQKYKHRKLPIIIIRDMWIFHASEIKKELTLDGKMLAIEPFYRPIIRKIKEFTEIYNPMKVYIENNQFQDVIVQMVKDPDLVGDTRIPAEGVYTGKTKHDEQKGIPMISTLLMSKRLIFPFGDDESATMMGSLQDELQKWILNPINNKYECTAQHDDKSMALYTGLTGILPRISRFVGVSKLQSPMQFRRDQLNSEAKEIQEIMAQDDFDVATQIAIAKPKMKSRLGSLKKRLRPF